MKILCNKTSGELMGITGNDIETEETITAKPPNGWRHEEMEKWRYDIDSGAIVEKKGLELNDALMNIAGRIVERLIAKYAGSTVSPQTIGLLEGACDLVVQVLNSWVNDIPLTAEETERWNEFYAQCAPFFVNELQGLSDDDIRDMSVAKSIARQIKVDMKADPEWPKEE